MSTFAIMKARIADELLRSDLTTQIEKAVLTAIQRNESRRFWFNEEVVTASTVAGQKWYDHPSNMIELDAFKVAVGNNSYDLTPKEYSELDALDVNSTFTGYPSFFANYQEQFRLYPTPNAVYTMTISYVKKFATLSADGDTNAWMVEGERLIRCDAKREILFHVIKDYEEAAVMERLYVEALAELNKMTIKKTATGRTRAHGI